MGKLSINYTPVSFYSKLVARIMTRQKKAAKEHNFEDDQYQKLIREQFTKLHEYGLDIRVTSLN
jgi:hypothetical protein